VEGATLDLSEAHLLQAARPRTQGGHSGRADILDDIVRRTGHVQQVLPFCFGSDNHLSMLLSLRSSELFQLGEEGGRSEREQVPLDGLTHRPHFRRTAVPYVSEIDIPRYCFPALAFPNYQGVFLRTRNGFGVAGF
jgi:hypothetical protein